MRQLLAAAAMLLALITPVAADSAVESREARLDALFAALKASDAATADEVAAEIQAIWNDAGSASMNLLVLRARRALEAGSAEAALTHLDDLIRLAPDFAEGWNARATVHYLAGSYRESLADIRETLRREPRHFGALAGRGLVLAALGRAAEALMAFEAALALHPHLEGPKEMARMLREELRGKTI